MKINNLLRQSRQAREEQARADQARPDQARQPIKSHQVKEKIDEAPLTTTKSWSEWRKKVECFLLTEKSSEKELFSSSLSLSEEREGETVQSRNRQAIAGSQQRRTELSQFRDCLRRRHHSMSAVRSFFGQPLVNGASSEKSKATGAAAAAETAEKTATEQHSSLLSISHSFKKERKKEKRKERHNR